MSLAIAPLDVTVEGSEASPAVANRQRPDAGARGVNSDLPCRTVGPDLWFADSPAELEFAKSLCTGCAVRLECLAGAVERAEPWGVWGGEIFERGAVVPRKRPRGRPRKTDAALDAVLRRRAPRSTSCCEVEVAARTEQHQPNGEHAHEDRCKRSTHA